MWLATVHGFYSVVFKEHMHHVRARTRGDLERLLRLSGLEKRIEVRAEADYRYRVLCTEEELVRVMIALAQTVDYSNYKNVIDRSPDQKEKSAAYHALWSALYLLQARNEGKPC